MQHAANQRTRLPDPRRALQPENHSRRPWRHARRARSHMWTPNSHTRALRADPPDPDIGEEPEPRSQRRYARWSWALRCARAMTCDRRSSRSATRVHANGRRGRANRRGRPNLCSSSLKTCSGRRLHGLVGHPPPGLWPGPALRRGEQPEALTAGRGRGHKAGIWDQGGSYRATSTLACVEQSPAAIMLVSGAANYVEKESPGPTHA